MKPSATLILAGLLCATFALRAARLDQPIVENYVGRQVPTAMVARNLDRGSGFLRPQLDTGPFPNLFLVEPPLFATFAVGLRRLAGQALGPSGRLVSALATVLAGWGLFGLARRREGGCAALWAVAAFAVFPLTLRYGRAFQPDALMLGLVVAGLACWDVYESDMSRSRGWPWLIAGWLLLAAGLAVKIVAAAVLVPLIAGILRPPRRGKAVLALLTLVPALLWYVHAARLLGEGTGSRASADNGSIWLGALGPLALGRAETWRHVGRFLVVRGFTPIGFGLAVVGLAWPSGGNRLWRLWGGSALAGLALLAGKLHHEYYWLVLAPVAAVGVGRVLAGLMERSRGAALAAAAGGGLLTLALVQSASTWRTPSEWSALPEAARCVRAVVPPEAWLVAPEALLFAADRRGCRLEPPGPGARRAAGEWGGTLADRGPLALIEFYRLRGARFVADVGGGAGDPARLGLREAIRGRYNVLVDRDGVLIAILNERVPRASARDGLR